ncbi:HNH endonuclease signature motif containing protein [Cupriavidus taiwanensis]|uniref:HNH endonuclease signature motif containing protein n=1 Tax=Cupriavidus taiwanensis TaxID=164546 RepID=UPI0018D52491
MLHRTVWRLRNGDIPEGHEIDHTCGSRDCCNPLHLRCITRAEHLDSTNRERYSARNADARRYWLLHKPTGAALGELFGVSFSAACEWIREWRKEQHETS